MTDTHPTTKVARDLTEIVNLVGDLREQAISLARSRLMPGGSAMVELGNVANLEAWGWMQDATERTGRAYTSTPDEDPDEAWPAYQILEFWSEAWRREHGAEYEGYRTTIVTEANFIRSCLDWAWDNEPHWDDFAADINRARVKLEEILYAGRRVDLSRIECDQCDRHPRLIRLAGDAEDGSDDRWKCPNPDCRARFDRSALLRAHGRQLRQEAAARYVDQGDAIATLRAQGRPERTVRKWLAPLTPLDECEECGETWAHQEYPACPKKDRWGEDCGGLLRTVWRGDREAVVEGYCEIGTRRRFVWWPDLWRKHLATPTRNRKQTA